MIFQATKNYQIAISITFVFIILIPLLSDSFVDFISGSFLINDNENYIPSLDITEIDLGDISINNDIDYDKEINKLF